MAGKILGAQTDFSFGEVDVSLKRADNHPARKGGLRQMSNARILNSGAIQNRSGRRALYPIGTTPPRTERFIMSPGNVFDIQFTPGRLRIVDSAGADAFGAQFLGGGGAIPWTTTADINSIVFAILGFSIYITFGHSMRPQVVTWNGASTWTMVDYTELAFSGQKRTPFYRISPQGIAIQPSGQTGSVTVVSTAPVFVAGQVGTRIRFVGRQLLITGFTNTQTVTATVEESIPGSQQVSFAVDPATAFSIGDEVRGSASNSVGIIADLNSGTKIITIQLTTSTSQLINPVAVGLPGTGGIAGVYAFTTSDTIVGPGGGIQVGTVTAIQLPQGVVYWDDEVMNNFRGYPASVFVDQFRLGFCDFPSVPGGVAWSAINSPKDIYVGANPNNAIFEIAPAKVQIYYVVPGPEGSEFVFCDRGVYYIPISPTNPLKPGSVAFQLLSNDGCAQVQPRRAQEAILYVNAGQNSVMAVIATGAYNRPFNTKNLSDFHSHLFNNIAAIAAPSADGSFNERYAYVLNGDGSIAVGKYDSSSLQGNLPVIGWGPWSGLGVVTWIAAFASDVIFTTTYFGFSTSVLEILDDRHSLDCVVAVNSPYAAFTPPLGKGPLWFIPSKSVTLVDQGQGGWRPMGTYQIDANGFIIPQGQGGENLAATDLLAGQPWTMITEPFCPNAQPGTDVGQRMTERQVANFGVSFVNSTGFVMASLFNRKQLPTSPPLGTVEQQRRFPMWDQGDDATKPPFLRESTETWRPNGSSFDPRVAIIKDTPGPLMIVELGIEVTV